MVRPDCLNFINPFGLGDTMTLRGYRKAIEKKHGLPVHLIVKPSHKIVMDMYVGDNYSLREFGGDELSVIARESVVPRRGALYVAHPLYSNPVLFMDWKARAYPVKKLWRVFLGLDEDAEFDPPLWYPPPPRPCPAAPENSVLLLPEANSVVRLKASFWERIAKKAAKEGFSVFQHQVNADNRIRGVPVLEGDLERVIGFALACSKVYSLRSGLCDLIAEKVKDLTVFYPDAFAYAVYRLERRFPEQKLTNALIRPPGERRSLLKKIARKLPFAGYILGRFRAIEERLGRLEALNAGLYHGAPAREGGIP
jgi:hypothetical protein